MPGFISPQLATLKMRAPSGGQWIHEIKYDGYRIQIHIDGDDRMALKCSPKLGQLMLEFSGGLKCSPKLGQLMLEFSGG
jgi:hypothetical protein